MFVSGVVKKMEPGLAHSDGEMDDVVWSKCETTTTNKPPLTRQSHMNSEPSAPARVTRRREIVCRSVGSEMKAPPPPLHDRARSSSVQK